MGDSILHRLRAKSVLIKENDRESIEQAESASGMILEVGTADPPFVFTDDDMLVESWIEYHRMYNAPLIAEEFNVLLEMKDDGHIAIENALLPPELRDDSEENQEDEPLVK